jgi:CrcB protein
MNLAGQLGLVATGGAAGALARYGVNLWMAVAGRTDFPYATLTVNALGSLVAGILFVLYIQVHASHGGWRLFAMVGFLGAFTTFSAFSVDTLLLLSAGHWRGACLNVVLNLALSLGLCGLGMSLTRAVIG